MMKMITVKTTIKSDLEKVWEYWTTPDHITQWNFATPEWHCPSAKNDLREGGTFSWRMEAKDGSMGFDYAGKYIKIEKPTLIKKELGDRRRVEITFTTKNGGVEVVETFEPDENDPELQKQGWQAILDNFKQYVEPN